MKKILKPMGWVLGLAALLFLNFNRDLKRNLSEVDWHPVERKTLFRTVSSPGVIEAHLVQTIKSEVNEKVLKKYVKEGNLVMKGDVLLDLTKTQTEIEFKQSESSFNKSRSDFRKAKKELKIQKQLFANQAVPRSQVEESQLALQRARESFEISKRQFELAKKKFNSTRVVSPIDGVVLKDMTVEGRMIGPRDDLMIVGDVKKFVVRAKVDELEIRDVKVGQLVEIKADAFPDQTIRGKVQKISYQAEREAFAKVGVTIDVIKDANIQLKHNLSVRAHILIEEIPNALGIPAKVISRKEGSTAWVLVKNRAGLIRERRIEVGQPAGEMVVVKEGLKEGEEAGIPRPKGIIF